MKKIGLVIQKEYIQRVKKKSFLIITIVFPLLLASFISIAIYLGLSENKVYNVLVIDEHSFSKKYLKSNEKIQFHYIDKIVFPEDFRDKEAYKTYDILFRIDPEIVLNAQITPDRPVEIPMYYKDYPSTFVEATLREKIERIYENIKLTYLIQTKQLNTFSRQDYEAINTKIHFRAYNVNKDTKAVSFIKEAVAVGFFFSAIIYFTILTHGVQVMRGVLEEKTSRIVEIILSSLKPFQLMAGKIIGVGLVGMTQFFLWIVFSVLIFFSIQWLFLPDIFEFLKEDTFQTESYQLTESMKMENIQYTMSFLTEDSLYDLIFRRINFPVILVFFFIFYIGGYFFYAGIFAMIGSMVDAEEDTQQFIFIVLLPLMFGFFIAQMALHNPESPYLFWFSLVPFTSPVVMMVRLAMGFHNNVWELYLSIGLLYSSIVMVMSFSAKVYKVGILTYGKKLRWRDVILLIAKK